MDNDRRRAISKPKLIQLRLGAISARAHGALVECWECKRMKPLNQMLGEKHEDVDVGDHIERRSIGPVCEDCMSPPSRRRDKLHLATTASKPPSPENAAESETARDAPNPQGPQATAIAIERTAQCP